MSFFSSSFSFLIQNLENRRAEQVLSEGIGSCGRENEVEKR
jgi:hypothetical protein